MDVLNDHDVALMQKNLAHLFLDEDMRPKSILVKKEHYAKLEAYFGEFLDRLEITLQSTTNLPIIELIKSELDTLSFFS